MRVNFGIVVWGVVGASAALAEEAPETLAPVVVTGTRTERASADAPVATQVVSRRDIDASGARSLDELLEQVVGVDVAQSFAGSGVRLQGLDPLYTLILIDGERVIGRTNGVTDISRIRLEDVERVEIVRGASSALYGSDAIAGVINVIRRKPRKPLSADLRTAWGNLGFGEVSGAGSAHGDRANVSLSGGWRRRDAFDLDPGTKATNGNAYVEWTTAARAELAIGRVRLQGRGEYLSRDQQGIDSNSVGAVLDRHNLTETGAASLAAEWTETSSGKWRISAYYTRFRDQFLLNQRGADDLDQYQDTRQQLGQSTVQYNRMLGSHHLVSAGADGLVEQLQSERLGSGRGDRQRGALFVQDEWAAVTREVAGSGERPWLTVVPGLRADLDSQFGARLSPKVALRYDPWPELVVRASYGWGFRAPDFRELLLLFQNPSVGYVVEGNPALQPETSASANLGAEWRVSRAVLITANLFRNDIDGLIQAQLLAAGAAGSLSRYAYQNIASAYTQGVETSVRVRPWPLLAVEGGYTFTDTRDVGRDRALAGRSRHRAALSTQFHHEAWGLQALVRGSYNGERPFYDDDQTPPVRTVGRPYVLLDARVAQQIAGHFQVFVQADNLLGAGDPVNLAIQPRLVVVGMTAKY